MRRDRIPVVRRLPNPARPGKRTQIRRHGYDLTDAPDARSLGGANGVTDFTTRTVTVRTDMPDATRVKTLTHELAHIVLGHKFRAGDGLHRGIGEIEAESVATMVTAAYGMDTSGYTVPYVARWSATVDDRDPVEVVRGTGELARRTALAILDTLPEPPIGDGTPPGLDTRSNEPSMTSGRLPSPRQTRHPDVSSHRKEFNEWPPSLLRRTRPAST